MLVLSWYMKAETMCTYTRDEFRRGLRELGCCTIDDIKAKVEQLRHQLRDPQIFSNVYMVRELESLPSCIVLMFIVYTSSTALILGKKMIKKVLQWI